MRHAPVLATVNALLACAAPLAAQGWTAQLVLSPLPSPFLSDWEVDPTVAEIVVTNSTAAAANVTFHYSLTRNGTAIVRGVTDPHTVSPGATRVFNATTDFGGRADWDRSIQDLVARTGRLPEGEYEGCVTLAGAGGVVLVERQCQRFTLQYPDPPFLVFPANGDTIHSQDPIFEWQPVQLPPGIDARLGYVLQVAEVRTGAGQLPATALESNILHYVQPNLVQTSHQYPVGALPLVSGRTYAWRVQALDGDGRPVATNQGRSEIWTFVYREPQVEVARTIARIELSARRDTLRYAGDTTRYEAVAFDANNVEIADARIAWRSLDTTVVRVDSSGLTRGVAAGSTRIVASADGIADSASTVLAAPTNLSVRFVTADAATNQAGLLELIRSGTFEDVAPRLIEMLQNGEFRIPLPRLPGVEAARGAAAGSGQGNLELDFGGAMRSRGAGPSATAEPWPGGAARACDDVAFNVRDPYLDLTEKVLVFYIPLNREQRQEVTNCLGVPNDEGEVVEAERLRGAIFVVSWKHPGFPRAILAVKGPGLGLTLAGPKVDVRYLVLNLTPAVEVGADLLPASFAGFFGDISFEAGFGLTYYSRRKCFETVMPFCRFLSWINPDNPSITIEAFAGVNASEMSGGMGGGGVSVALGFTLSASLPVRRWNRNILGGSLDSTQVGLSFAAQDSLVEGAGSEDGPNQSVNIAPTLKVWFTGSGGRSWEIDGSVAFEIDPAEPDEVKLVIAAEVPTRWKLWLARLGNPTVIYSHVLVPDGDTELGLSGTWGIGPWDGNTAELVGIDEGDAGFEEMGRGSVVMKWEKPKPAAAANPVNSRMQERQAQWDNARRTAAVHLAAVQRNCDDAERELAYARSRLIPGDMASLGFLSATEAKSTALCRQVALEKQRQAAIEGQIAAEKSALEFQKSALEAAAKATPALAGAPSTTPATPTCEGTLVFGNTRCYTWQARLSFASSSLVDLMALIMRLAGRSP